MIRELLKSAVLAGVILVGSALAQPEGIRVAGSGTVYGEPDLAVFSVGINTLDADVSVATMEADETAAELIAALSGAGVAEDDLQTSNYNVYREDWHSGPDGEQGEPLYRVINTLTVTVRDVAQVGDLIGVALAAGANQVDSLRFTIADAEQLLSEARALAVEDARQRAEELAELTGVTLGEPVHIEEFSTGGLPVLRQSYGMAMAESSGPPIEAGELSVSVELAIVYRIVGD